MNLPILYMLLVVFTDGRLAVTDHIKTLSICRQAESVAKYGLTLEEVEKGRADYTAAVAGWTADWARENPWRKPENAWEEEAANSGRMCVQWFPGMPCQLETSNGLLRKPKPHWITYAEKLQRLLDDRKISQTVCLRGEKTP